MCLRHLLTFTRRWTNWVVVIVSGIAWVVVAIVPETYAPRLLRKRARKQRQETGDDSWWSRYDDKQSFTELLKVNLSRPFVLTVTEPICLFWDVYIALVYGILYLCFVAYPIVFTDMRGWTPGFSGLAFTGIGVGGMITIFSEPLIRKMINAHKHDPETDRPYPEAMVSVVCIASILIPTGEIWFAWTCTPNVHWIWPILGGIPFGAGNAGVFIYASNYLVQSYDVFAASALAGNAVLRSIMGATLPLAGPASTMSEVVPSCLRLRAAPVGSDAVVVGEGLVVACSLSAAPVSCTKQVPSAPCPRSGTKRLGWTRSQMNLSEPIRLNT